MIVSRVLPMGKDPIRNPEWASPESLRIAINGWRTGSPVRSEETGEVDLRYRVSIKAITDHHTNQDQLVCKLFNKTIKDDVGIDIQLIDPEMSPPKPLRERIVYINDTRAGCYPYLRRDPQSQNPIGITYRRAVFNVFVAIPPLAANQGVQPVPQFALMAAPGDVNALAVEYLPCGIHK